MEFKTIVMLWLRCHCNVTKFAKPRTLPLSSNLMGKEVVRKQMGRNVWSWLQKWGELERELARYHNKQMQAGGSFSSFSYFTVSIIAAIITIISINITTIADSLPCKPTISVWWKALACYIFVAVEKYENPKKLYEKSKQVTIVHLSEYVNSQMSNHWDFKA